MVGIAVVDNGIKPLFHQAILFRFAKIYLVDAIAYGRSFVSFLELASLNGWRVL